MSGRALCTGAGRGAGGGCNCWGGVDEVLRRLRRRSLRSSRGVWAIFGGDNGAGEGSLIGETTCLVVFGATAETGGGETGDLPKRARS